jgi:hypothetical protein
VARNPQPSDRAPAKSEGNVVLSAICILAAGVLRASLPATEFTLAWEHSVEKTRWEERYVVEGNRLRLTEARIQGFGAGMEPPAGARFVDGWWTWRPALEPLPALRLTRSNYTHDYTLCWRDTCSALGALVGAGARSEAVTIEPCATSAG